MASYPTPTVDVDVQTMGKILSARPDIQALYRANARPDGRPWYPNDVPDVPAIINDWWTRVAGGNDAPGLYGNSLAEWANIFLGGGSVVTATPSTGGSVRSTQSTGTPGRGNIFITGAVILMGVIFFIGGRRTSKAALGTYVSHEGPAGGGVPAATTRRRK